MQYLKKLLRKIQGYFQRLLGIKQIEMKLEAIQRAIENSSNTLSPVTNTLSPVDLFIVQNFQFERLGHFHEHYVEWRMRRIRKILEICGGVDFKGMRILEIGGGTGNIGGFFAALGADVTSLEGRTVNRNLANLMYGEKYKFKSVFADLENDFSDIGQFDIIINFGLLEVIKNIDSVMECCSRMSDCIFLETMVCDSLDATVIPHAYAPSGIDNPLHGVGSFPSPLYIENFFRGKQYGVEQYFHADLNTSIHVYDWVHQNDNSCVDGRRRFWRFKRL